MRLKRIATSRSADGQLLIVMTKIDPTATLHAFDAFLAREGLAFSGVVIGGAALHALGHAGA